MPCDVNQETITPRISHFAAELNVENLCAYSAYSIDCKSVWPYWFATPPKLYFACTERRLLCLLSLGKYMTDHLTYDWRVYFSRPIRFSRTLVCRLFKNLWFSCRRSAVPLPIDLAASPLARRLRAKTLFRVRLQYRQLRSEKRWKFAGNELKMCASLAEIFISR